MTAHSLTTAAIANAEILRQIRKLTGDGIPSRLLDLADMNPAIRKDIIKRSLERLTADGILSYDDYDGALAAPAWRLTGAGERALLALDVAEGLVQGGLRMEHEAARQQRWPIDKLYPNPDNPERPADEERDANFRESIIAAGDLLQPLVVSPVDATGGRMIWDGHRRWENCRVLVEDGTLPAQLVFGLPFVELEIDPAIPRAEHRVIALRTALIANEQRADIPPWEDAKLLALYADLTGEPGKPRSARQVALDLGRANPGSETGVKDVQRKIKVVREAKPADIARHEADPVAFNWEWLRGTVEEKKGLTAKQLMVLAEVCEACVRAGLEPDKRATLLVLPPHERGGDYGLVMAGLIGFGPGNGGQTSLMVFDRAWAELEAQTLYDPAAPAHERDEILLGLRASVVSPAKAAVAETTGQFITEWLNLPQAESRPITGAGDDVEDPAPPADARPPLAGPAPTSTPSADLALSPAERLAMLELAHKVEHHLERPLVTIDGGASYAVRVGAYWLSETYTALKGEVLGLIVHAHNEATGGKAYAALTQRGEDWIDRSGFDRDQAQALAEARRAVGAFGVSGGYATAWLNVQAGEDSAPLTADDGPPEMAQTIDEDKDRQATAILETHGLLPPDETPVLQALAALWVSGGEILGIARGLPWSPDSDIAEEEWQGRLTVFQMALWGAAAQLPASEKACHLPTPAPLFSLNAGDVVNCGGSQDYRLLGVGQGGGSATSFQAQAIRNGKDYGKPRGIYLSDIRHVKTRAGQ